jgi:hypothetical protein
MVSTKGKKRTVPKARLNKIQGNGTEDNEPTINHDPHAVQRIMKRP